MSAALRLAALFEAHAAAAAELRKGIEQLLPDLAREHLTAALANLGTPTPEPKKRKTIVQRDLKPVKPTSKQEPQAPRCGKCKQRGYNARTCGKAKPSADADSEDEPAVRLAIKPPRASREVTTIDERVIEHGALVRMLAADRAANDGGDAGGYVARVSSAPSLIGHTDEKREHCPVHGWVGRVAFDREHFACLPVGEACSRCHGNLKRAGSITCRRCGGTGIEPAPVEAVVVPPSVPTVEADDLSVLVGDRRHRRRNPEVPRSHTISARRITRTELRIGAIGIEQELAALDDLRPKTRAECANGPRPCPWVSCKHHLALDVNAETGSIKLNFPDREVWEISNTCALDVAEGGTHTLEQIGSLLNVTRERLRQVESSGLSKLRELRIVKQIGPGDFVDRKEAL